MNIDIVRAWKDVDYRESLSEEQRALLPENPAGAFELTEAQLESVLGGMGIDVIDSGGCSACSTANGCGSSSAIEGGVF